MGQKLFIWADQGGSIKQRIARSFMKKEGIPSIAMQGLHVILNFEAPFFGEASCHVIERKQRIFNEGDEVSLRLMYAPKATAHFQDCLRRSQSQTQVYQEKFCRATGLEPIGSPFVGIADIWWQEHVHCYHSCFISGRFLIKEPMRFTSAWRLGIGERKSYGHGLILLDDEYEKILSIARTLQAVDTQGAQVVNEA